MSCSKFRIYHAEDTAISNKSHSGHYYCALLTVRSSVPALQHGSGSVDTTKSSTASHQQEIPSILPIVLEAVKILREFRRTYGFKSSLAYIFQTAAVVSLILLNYLGSSPTTSPNPVRVKGPSNTLDLDLTSAFNEAYRCLLAMGTRIMIGRGVARMVYHTSRAANMPLPVDTQRLLDVVNEIVWTSTDVQQIRSSFPNWAMKKSLNDSEMRMEGLLKQWEELNLETTQGA
jgi:hypothetical protein